MGTLLKYEFRRSRLIYLSIVGITIFMELLYLIGWGFQIDTLLGIGLLGGIVCIALGASAILLYGILQFHGDISKRQGYLLFATPRSARQIVLAKLLLTLLALIGISILFGVLIGLDIALALQRSGETLLSIMKALDPSVTAEQCREVFLTPYNIVGLIMTILTSIFSFVFQVVIAYLVITALKTIMGNQKGRLLLAIIAWFVITNGISTIGGFITGAFLNHEFGNTILNTSSLMDTLSLLLQMFFHPAFYLPSLILYILCSIAGFWGTTWLMDKKMSL